jgi:hypothetical protein
MKTLVFCAYILTVYMTTWSWAYIRWASDFGLKNRVWHVVTVYLYRSLDSDIYITVPNGISIPNANIGRNMYCVKLNKLLYGLKQSGKMWYNRLKEFLLNKSYFNNDDCPCVFIRKSSTRFYIISIYIDDLNIIGSELDIKRHMIILRWNLRWKI